MITRHLTIACAIYLVLTLQTGVAGDCTFVNFTPWLPGIVVVGCVLAIDGASRVIWAGLLGLGLDCQSLDRLGLHLVVATLVAGLLIEIKSDTRSHSVFALTMYVFGATFIWRASAAMAHGLIDQQPLDLLQSITSSGYSAVSTSGFAALVLIGVRFVKSVLRPRQTSSVSLSNQWSMLTGN